MCSVMMWKFLTFVFVLNFGVFLARVYADCDSISEECADHEQCCGGCCFHGECIDTYRSCLSNDDVCQEHVCHGSEICVSYIPPQCPGCEPLPICQLEAFKK